MEYDDALRLVTAMIRQAIKDMQEDKTARLLLLSLWRYIKEEHPSANYIALEWMRLIDGS